MERSQLDKMSIEQLRTEAERYALQTTGDQQALIDRIMTHLERHGPMQDLNTGFVAEAGANEHVLLQETREDGMTCHRLQVKRRSENNNGGYDAPTAANAKQLAPIYEGATTTIFVFAKELSATGREPSPASDPPEPRMNGSPRLAENANGSPANLNFSPGSASGLGTGNSVKWLASQIPEFSGAEDKNVVLWTQKVDRVARIHAATDGATLLATSSRLTKNAKK